MLFVFVFMSVKMACILFTSMKRCFVCWRNGFQNSSFFMQHTKSRD